MANASNDLCLSDVPHLAEGARDTPRPACRHIIRLALAMHSSRSELSGNQGSGGGVSR